MLASNHKDVRLSRFIQLLFSMGVLIGFPLFGPEAQAAYQIQIDKAVYFLTTSSPPNADGSWGSTPEKKMFTTPRVIEALEAAGIRKVAYYRGLTWLENQAAPNFDYAAQRIQALTQQLADVRYQIDILENAQNTAQSGRSGWGVGNTYFSSPLDTANVIRALLVTNHTANIQAAVNFLKSMQRGNGGWSLASESTSDPFVTATVVIALASWMAVDSSLNSVVNNAINYLTSTVTTQSTADLKALVAWSGVAVNKRSSIQYLLDNLVSTQHQYGGWDNNPYYTALGLRALVAADGLDDASLRQIVLIPDANLRASINAALGKGRMDNLMRFELAQLITLSASNWGIHDLTGLEYAINLTSADLSNNLITSTSPIDSLPQHPTVNFSGNPVSLAADVDNDIPFLPVWGYVVLSVLFGYTGIKRRKLGNVSASH